MNKTIDQFITNVQANIVWRTNNFFVGHRFSRVVYGAYIVMPLTIGLTGSLDYIKLPIAGIVELVKSILFLPQNLYNPSYSHHCFTHLKNSKNYGIACIDKLLVGWIADLQCMVYTFKRPLSVPFFAEASYFGARLIYNQKPTKQEQLYPSICLTTL